MDTNQTRNSDLISPERYDLFAPYKGHRVDEKLRDGYYRDLSSPYGDNERGLREGNHFIFEMEGYQLLLDLNIKERLASGYLHEEDTAMPESFYEERGKLDRIHTPIYSRFLRAYREVFSAFESPALEAYFVREQWITNRDLIRQVYRECGLEKEIYTDWDELERDEEKLDNFRMKWEEVLRRSFHFKRAPFYLENLSFINGSVYNERDFWRLCDAALPERLYVGTLIYPRDMNLPIEEGKEKWFKDLPRCGRPEDMFNEEYGYIISNDQDYWGFLKPEDEEYREMLGHHTYMYQFYALPILPVPVIKYYFEGETAEKLIYFHSLAENELDYDPFKKEDEDEDDYIEEDESEMKEDE